MAKFEITIEEHVTKDFEVEANSIEEAMEIARINYKRGLFVLVPGEVQEKLMSVYNPETDESTDFVEFK